MKILNLKRTFVAAFAVFAFVFFFSFVSVFAQKGGAAVKGQNRQDMHELKNARQDGTKIQKEKKQEEKKEQEDVQKNKKESKGNKKAKREKESAETTD